MNMSKENHTRTKHYDDAHSRDRHVSGTGRGKEVQKDGSGKYSWGKIIDTGDTLLFGMGGRGNNEKEIVNEETITYDEYMAKKRKNYKVVFIHYLNQESPTMVLIKVNGHKFHLKKSDN